VSELAYCGHPMTAPRECGQCLAEARAEVERLEAARENDAFTRDVLRREIARHRAAAERLREALTRIAGIPDRNGHTHGARLHDVGAMMEEARAALGEGA